jgi:lipid A 3-O-deacylase
VDDRQANLFTPEDHEARNPRLDDRPYAGWLYTGLNFIQDLEHRQLTALRILGGVIGPWALGRQTQNAFHDIIGSDPVRGWGFQLGNEFGFIISWERKWRFNRELSSGYSWELIPDVGLTAGNIYDFAKLGGLVRWGRGLNRTGDRNLSFPAIPEPPILRKILSTENLAGMFFSGCRGVW